MFGRQKVKLSQEYSALCTLSEKLPAFVARLIVVVVSAVGELSWNSWVFVRICGRKAVLE